MPSTRLILVVHAATAATRRAAFAVGEEAPDPADLKHALRWQGRQPTTLASPALAARLTAGALGFDAATDPALRDLDVGMWRGLAPTDVSPEHLAAWISDPSYADHGGEARSSLAARVKAWLEQTRAVKGTIVAVTHAAVLRAALVAILDAPATAFWRIDAPPFTALVASSDARRWTLRSLGPCRDAFTANGG